MKDFSLCNRILMECDKRFIGRAEREFQATSDAATKRDPKLGHEGFVLPDDVVDLGFGRRDLTASGGDSGDQVIATELHNTIINVKANSPIVVKAGATVFTGLEGDQAIPRATGNPSAAWLAENGANTESTPTFDQVTLSPNRVGGHVEISRRLLLQATPQIEQWLRTEIARQVNLAIDSAAINGSGSGNEPEGILNTTGIGAYSATSGADSASWAMVCGLWKEVAQDNTDVSALRWLLSPSAVSTLANTRKDTGSGKFVIENLNDGLLGSPIFISNQVPTNLGSGGALGAVIIGDMRDCWIGLFGSPVVIVDPYTNAKTGLVRIFVEQYVDIAIAQASSFAAVSDLTLA